MAAFDLQTVYARVREALASRTSCLRFLASYTDGGADGDGVMALNYWADHALMPNQFAPHCTDGPGPHTLVGLLRVRG